MCGIAGFITAGDNLPERHVVQAMCRRLVHRGPDGEGYFLDSEVALGHRRLSIIDLAGGAQPLGNEDGSIQVVFNGEIYNYRELQKDLLRKGHQFRTSSDTEVLVHLYEEVGERLPEYLNGMFAFAIWDARRKELFLARDRFGKKPVYYSENVPGYRLCFASELKALTILPDFDTTPDPVGVATFLSLSYVPDPRSIYGSASKLPPGSSMTVSAGGAKLRRYWKPVMTAGGTLDERDALDKLTDLAGDAVERRMISDVPLGAFLSGGIDSSTTVAFMNQCAPGLVKTFSIGFTNKKFDELRYARMVAGRYGTEHYEEVVSPQVHEILDVLVEHYDEPFGDASAIPTLYLARMTRKFVTVALSGDGADELFGGYRRYAYGIIEERVRNRFPEWFRRNVFRFGGRYYPKFDYLPRVFRAKTTLTNLSMELADAYYNAMAIFRDDKLDAVLSPELRREVNGASSRDAYRERFHRYRHLPPLQQLQAVDIETYLPGDILVKADRATMAYSLESRSPWLDYRIGELSFQLPVEMKIQGLSGKHIFKKMAASRIPQEIIDRPKMGFATPLGEWFRSSLRPVFQQTVLDSSGVDAYLNRVEIRRLWGEHQSGMHDHSRKLWNLLMFACWNRRHKEGSELNLAAAVST